MMMLIGPRHSSGAHDFRAPLEWRAPMKVSFQEVGSVDSWTLGPKPLCHRRPTGPHPSGLLWTPWTPTKGDSTKSSFALVFVVAQKPVEIDRLHALDGLLQLEAVTAVVGLNALLRPAAILLHELAQLSGLQRALLRCIALPSRGERLCHRRSLAFHPGQRPLHRRAFGRDLADQHDLLGAAMAAVLA